MAKFGAGLKSFARKLLLPVTIAATISLLPVAAFSFLLSADGNEWMRARLESYLAKKLQTRVIIGRLYTHGISTFTFHDFQISDRQGKNLLSFRQLSVKVSWAYFWHGSDALFQNIRLEMLRAYFVQGDAQNDFNYQFVLDAFSSGDSGNLTQVSDFDWLVPEHISLNQISIEYKDSNSGDSAIIRVARLNSGLDIVDEMIPAKWVAKNLLLDSALVQLNVGKKTQTSAPAATGGNLLALIEVNRFQSLRSALRLTNAEGLCINSNWDKLSLNGLFYSSAKRQISVSKFISDQLFTVITTPAKAAEKEQSTNNDGGSYHFRVDTLAVINNRFLVDIKSARRWKDKRFDPFHNEFSNVNISATSLNYDDHTAACELKHFSFSDARRFHLRSATAAFAFRKNTASLNGLRLVTDNNNTSGNITFKYPSQRAFLATPETVNFKAKLDAQTLSLQELAYFLPVLSRYTQIKPLYAQKIRAKVDGSGSFRNIRLASYDVITRNNHLRGSGQILAPANAESLIILDIENFRSGKLGLTEIVDRKVLGETLLNRFPDHLSLSGKIKISSKKLSANARIDSEFGPLQINGTFNNYTSLDRIKYDFEFDAIRFELGAFLSDTLFGAVTSKGVIKGIGIADWSQMQLQADGFANAFTAGGKQFESISYSSDLAENLLHADLSSTNPDMNFEISPTIYLNNPSQLGQVRGTIYKADLGKLGFVNDSLSIGVSMIADLKKITADTLIGQVGFTDIRTSLNGKEFRLDSLAISADYANQQRVKLHSDIADFQLTGQFQIAQLPVFFKNLFNSVWNGKTLVDSTNIHSFEATANLHNPAALKSLVPDISGLLPFQLTSTYNQPAGIFTFQTRIDSVVVGGLVLDSLYTRIETKRNGLTGLNTTYRLGAKNLTTATSTLPDLRVNGNIIDGVNAGKLLVDEKGSKSFFQIPFIYHGEYARAFISLRDSLYLSGNRWELNNDNAIYLNAENFGGTSFSIKNGAKSLSFESDPTSLLGLPYQIKLANFSLGPIFSVLNVDSTLAQGVADGSIAIEQLTPLRLTALVNVQELALKCSPFGRLTAEIRSEDSGDFSITSELKSDRRLLYANGNYNPEIRAGKIKINAESFPMTSLTGFVAAEIDSLKGNLKGQIDVGIDSSGIAMDGLLSLDSSSFIVRETGSNVQIVKGGLLFSRNQIALQPIHLSDGKSGKGFLTGSMDLSDFEAISYILNFNSEKFEAIGALRNRDQPIYGHAKTNANLELTGDFNELKLVGNVAISDSSKIFYKNATASSNQFGDGLLDFVVPDSRADITAKPKADPRSMRRLINTDVSVPRNATLTLLLDEYTGEKIVVSGTSNLNYSQHAGGEIQLNGKYEVASGSYTFSVGTNIRKEFALENGGTIQWLGNVKEPVCDLTAVYKVNTSAAVLLKGTETDAEAGRKKFDFLVKLKVKGNLSKPEISFELDMNERDQDAFDGAIYSKLKQINSTQSDVTKQVMSLLVLNSFMGDSPFGSLDQLSSSSMEVGAYNTIGNLLTSELNAMLSGMVKAVDITLGVNWSQSTDGGRSSTRSDIKLGLGKSLFNNRLNLYVGNNFGIETLSGTNSGLSGLANDVSVEYLLNPEGKYRIKGYHVRDNELTLHGEHMETGVKFMIVWDFQGIHIYPAKKVRKRTDL
jgi:translocation and assembly module TamB